MTRAARGRGRVSWTTVVVGIPGAHGRTAPPHFNLSTRSSDQNLVVRTARQPAPADSPPAGVSRPRARRAAFGVAAALGVVTLVYVWVVSAGTWATWPTVTTYYDDLADAFLAGRTSLLQAPDPRLLALPDPYDPVANKPYRVHDLSLYEGRYYLYWGPAPAALLAAVKGATGAEAVGDQCLVFVFALGTVLAGAVLLSDLWRQYFPNAPWWTPGLAVLALGLCNPMPFILARGAVYEAAIVAGQCFLLGGLCLLVVRSGDKWWRPSVVRLLLVGVCWSLAVASRLSLAPAVGALVLLAVWRLRRRPQGIVVTPVLALPALVLPLVLTVLALGAYNHTRFGSWREFGQQYQLGATNLRPLADKLMSAAAVPPNLHSYLLRPVFVGGPFPYVRPLSAKAPGSFPDWLPVPGYYDGTFAVSGILLVCPFVWFAAVTAAWLIFRRKGRGDDSAGLAWLVTALLLSVALALGPVLLLLGSTMRYLADFTPCLVVLATLGFWLAYDGSTSRPRRVGLALWAVFTVGFSITLGGLLAFSAEGNHFFRHNPSLMETAGASVEPVPVR